MFVWLFFWFADFFLWYCFSYTNVQYHYTILDSKKEQRVEQRARHLGMWKTYLDRIHFMPLKIELNIQLSHINLYLYIISFFFSSYYFKNAFKQIFLFGLPHF